MGQTDKNKDPKPNRKTKSSQIQVNIIDFLLRIFSNKIHYFDFQNDGDEASKKTNYRTNSKNENKKSFKITLQRKKEKWVKK